MRTSQLKIPRKMLELWSRVPVPFLVRPSLSMNSDQQDCTNNATTKVVPLQRLDTNWNKLETYSRDADEETRRKILELTIPPRTSPWRGELETWMAVLVLSELAAKPQKMFKLCTVRSFFRFIQTGFSFIMRRVRAASRKKGPWKDDEKLYYSFPLYSI